jgi:hypothetical protein
MYINKEQIEKDELDMFYNPVQPEVVTNRSFLFPGDINKMIFSLKVQDKTLSIKEKILIWLDCKFPRFMIFRMRLKGWKF